MKLLPLLLILFVTTACGNKKSKSSIHQIFVKGNPITMIEGTIKDTTSFITPANFSGFNNFALTGMYIFAEKELITKRESANIEDGQEAEEEDQTTGAAMIFNTQALSLKNNNDTIRLNFENIDSKLNLVSVKFDKTVYPAVIEHYSLSKDKSKMSFLFHIDTPEDGKTLVNMVFHRHSTKQTISKVSKDYHYLYGPGVVVPWKLDTTRKISVDVCPSLLVRHPKAEVEGALKAWEAPFISKTNKLIIDVKFPESCKPFSDVDQHSIHYVSSYLTVNSKNQYNPGFTMPLSDKSVGNIIDADIILLGSEIRKDWTFNRTEMNRVLTHELGHFLGLDHQFDGTTSIMSYENEYRLSIYDDKAITELYKN